MLLETRGLVSGYGKVTVLHGVDLKVETGEVVVALGSNGAGKSTLLKALAGHLPVTSGHVLLEGHRIEGKHASQIAQAGIGYVPQESNIFDRLSVRENLVVSALRRDDGGREAVDTALERFPILAERADQRASTLSGGERQILAINSALVLSPKLLLLDEPTSGLSPVMVEAIVDWVAEIAAEGVAGVLWVVEQNPEPVLAISGRTYVLEGGEVTTEVRSADLLVSGRLERLLLEDAPAAPGADLDQSGD
jgi:branched-chain amino acid transport system ATP-binding protein